MTPEEVCNKLLNEKLVKEEMLDALKFVARQLEYPSEEVFILNELDLWRAWECLRSPDAVKGNAIVNAFYRLTKYIRYALMPYGSLESWLKGKHHIDSDDMDRNMVRRRWIAAIIKAIQQDTDVMPDWVTELILR